MHQNIWSGISGRMYIKPVVLILKIQYMAHHCLLQVIPPNACTQMAAGTHRGQLYELLFIMLRHILLKIEPS